MGTLAPKLYNDEHMFGKNSKFEEWNATRYIHDVETTASEESLSPYVDLGRDVQYKKIFTEKRIEKC